MTLVPVLRACAAAWYTSMPFCSKLERTGMFTSASWQTSNLALALVAIHDVWELTGRPKLAAVDNLVQVMTAPEKLTGVLP